MTWRKKEIIGRGTESFLMKIMNHDENNNNVYKYSTLSTLALLLQVLVKNIRYE